MKKLLIQHADGTQSIQEVSDSGRAGLGIVVIWDDSVDGTMPATNSTDMGGYSKNGDNLDVNRTNADAQATKESDATTVIDRKATLQGKMNDDTATLSEIREYLAD